MWLVAGQSVIGGAHEVAGLPCQDHCGHRESTVVPGRRLVALADGAGTAAKGERGAQVAVEAMLRQAGAFGGKLSDLGEEAVSQWFDQVRSDLARVAESDGSTLEDHACTLLLAMFEGSEAWFWQIGDGAWVVQTPDGIEAATWPHTGEYVNHTMFVTTDGAETEWVQAHFTDVHAAIGFTDGLEHLCLDFAARTPHRPVVDKLLGSLQGATEEQVSGSIRSLLGSPLVNGRTDDDKTLVIAWRKSRTDLTC